MAASRTISTDPSMRSTDASGCWSLMYSIAVGLFLGLNCSMAEISQIAAGEAAGMSSFKFFLGVYSQKTPNFEPSLQPSGHSYLLGKPRTEIIFDICSFILPGKRGYIKYNSAIIHPKAKMSTGLLQLLDLKTSQGALYHLVETQSVKGSFDLIYRASPKSIILTWLLLMRIFQGLRSLWKYPFLCMQERPRVIWYMICLMFCQESRLPLCLIEEQSQQRLVSKNQKTKFSQSLTLSTSLSFIMFGWISLRRLFTQRRFMHSQKSLNFSFIFLMASSQPVPRCCA